MTKTIAELNDLCRQNIMIPVFGKPEVPCRIYMTHGVANLSPVEQIIICAEVRNFNDFTEDNDPYGEHNFGTLTVNNHKIFWKIDYYDPTMTFHSDDPADVFKTVRVLTIMLAEEY